MSQVFRIHPCIGIARVGTSEAYYLGPETMAGLPTVPASKQTGGLPIKPGTESETISSDDLRDATGALKRQAARFRIYVYPEVATESYPRGDGQEITIGSVVDGKKVADIVWTVHVANKKANWYDLDDNLGVAAYDGGKTPSLRNLAEGANPADPNRLRKLMIDPGPRAIRGASTAAVEFDAATTASYWTGTAIAEIAAYPKSFPAQAFAKLQTPAGKTIDSLGRIETDAQGRLLVVAASGLANGWYRDGKPPELDDDVNNDGWFDDVADGPVTATLLFADGSSRAVDAGAWVVTTDPAYAPQILNAVTLWDDIYDSWIRKLGLRPEVFSGGQFNAAYAPAFKDEVQPMFVSASLQRWVTNLNTLGIGAHDKVDAIASTDDPNATLLGGLGFVRNPNDPSQQEDARRMPLSLGDAGQSFLSLSKTQYFFLQQWDAKKASSTALALGPGEALDKAVLVDCLGGRFSPGIDMTFICREVDLYRQDWKDPSVGPFRIKAKPLDYAKATKDDPFLTVGYTPRRDDTTGLEPGDVSKFMAIPWHTDYNSCATHLPSPNPQFNNTLFWSWPAQRPVSVYLAREVTATELPRQRFSVRGEGTATSDPAQVGRYQDRVNMLLKWQDIGTVMQSTAIAGQPGGPDAYLEVQSRLDDSGDSVTPWPNTVSPGKSG